MSAEDTPEEAGLGFAVDENHRHVGSFVPRRRPRRRLRTLVAADPRSTALGAEPVVRHGEPVGHVTSATFSPSLLRTVVLAWLPPSVRLGEQVTVEYFGREQPFVVSPTACIDPSGDRLRDPRPVGSPVAREAS